jgi:hypothetical protein
MTKRGQAAIFRKIEDKYGLSRLTVRYGIARRERDEAIQNI